MARTFGKAAAEAYTQKLTDGNVADGWAWEKLTPESQVAWEAAGQAAVDIYRYFIPGGDWLGVASQWQPIETLPKHPLAPSVLIWDGIAIGMATWNSTTKKLNIHSHTCEPTHWMPLPEPPREGA